MSGQAERCEALASKGGFGALMAALDDKQMRTVRCRLGAGHDGKHHGWYCPFPGFADEHMYWAGES